MAVSDITDINWTIARINDTYPTIPGWDGSHVHIINDQLAPVQFSIEATTEGDGIGNYNFQFYITDPQGIIYSGSSGTAANNQTPATFISVDKMGTYVIEIVINDGNNSRTFSYDLSTNTQYDSGGGVMVDIPTTITGEAQPPWEWIPAAGYYNRGDGKMTAGTTPVALNGLFQCDIITRQCRPKYLGSPIACPVMSYGNPHVVMNRIVPANRKIPAALLAHKKSQNQSTCWCWAIKPKYGDWEGYTSLNRNIDLPEYTNEMGNVVPALTYLCSYGVQPTTMPVRLSLAKNATDVTVLAFDRAKLQIQYYTGAQFEVFEINYAGDLSERWVGSSGLLGNTKITDNTATIELTPWPDLANRPLGREVQVLCDVGISVNEEFGTGRCRNMALLDGPAKDDWTWQTSIYTNDHGSTTSVIGNILTWEGHQSNVLYSPTPVTMKSGNTIPENWHLHLREGKVLFTSGANAGIERDILTASPGALLNGGVWYELHIQVHIPFPFAPAAGDTLEVTAGCRRTTVDCLFYNNISNFRGFPNVPGKEGVIRRYEEN